ncbi:MAG: LytTR family DNA-binding domain-containing protein [Kordiimonas sp.]
MTIDDLQNFWGSRDPKVILKRKLLHLLVGIVLGTLGPYDSSNLESIILRFGYWIGLVLFGSMISGIIARRFFPWFKKQWDSVQLAFLGFCALMSVPIFLAVIIIDLVYIRIIFEEIEVVSLNSVLKHLLEMPLGLLGYLLLYGQVLVVSVMAFGSVVLLASNHRKKPKEPVEKVSGLLFLNRLPPEIGTDLLCLAMEDHYVRAHTKKGDALVLMRMADAIAELSDYAGTQIHRSWWVSYAAIQKVSKEKRRYFVHLTNGLKAPVSQTHVEKLRDMKMI